VLALTPAISVKYINFFFELQFFTWDSQHESMSWWKHLETEIPALAKMGFTQVWLPPPNKAAVKVRFVGGRQFCMAL
jgi:hypothetical protein